MEADCCGDGGGNVEKVESLRRIVSAVQEMGAIDVGIIQSLVKSGEWLVAFEVLCTRVYDLEMSLPASFVRLLEDLGDVLGASPSFVARLWEDVADEE